MFSIICAYNNKKMLEDCVIKSLKKQKNIEYETIFVNAKQHHFSSASETLNYGGRQAKGEYLIFLHQDIIFESENVLEKIKYYCDHFQFGIAGVAGLEVKNSTNRRFVTQIKDGKNHTYAGSDRAIHQYQEPRNVVSLDECLFIIPHKIFKLFQFNNLGKTWHLYASDFTCNCIKHNLKAIVLPIENIWHLSDGKSFSYDYFSAVEKLAILYRKDFKIIYTSYGKWPTARIILQFKIFYRRMRYKLFNK